MRAFHFFFFVHRLPSRIIESFSFVDSKLSKLEKGFTVSLYGGPVRLTLVVKEYRGFCVE